MTIRKTKKDGFDGDGIRPEAWGAATSDYYKEAIVSDESGAKPLAVFGV